LYINTTL